jgi:hypothetical protein
MDQIVENTMKAVWSIGGDGNWVELEFIYDLANLFRSPEKKYVKAILKDKDTHTFKLTPTEPSFEISVSPTKNHFGVNGVIRADFNDKIVYFAGEFVVNSVKCPPPPPPESKMVLFSFY